MSKMWWIDGISEVCRLLYNLLWLEVPELWEYNRQDHCPEQAECRQLLSKKDFSDCKPYEWAGFCRSIFLVPLIFP